MRIYSSSALVVSYDIVVPGMRTIKAMKLWQSPENLFLREKREERETETETETKRQTERDATNKTKRKEEWSWFVRGLKYSNPLGIYLLKVNSRNTRTRCEIFSKLTIKTKILVSLLLTLKIFHILLWCFYC